MYTHVGEVGLNSLQIGPIQNTNHNKPVGCFWISINNDWERWCEIEMPHWLNHPRHKITLSKDARVLSIKNLKDAESCPKQIPEFLRSMPAYLRDTGEIYLDFEELAKQYDVVEIYAGSNAELYHAFCGWDCDSAIVMNNVVEEIQEIGF